MSTHTSNGRWTPGKWGRLDLLLVGAGEIFTADGPPLRDAVLGIAQGHIAFLGTHQQLMSGDLAPDEHTPVLNLEGRLLTPGLVECHTHLVFAGDRTDEYARRATGVSYATIAREGGGIAATMRATRAASQQTLVDLARPRLHRLLAQGVTTAEVKSGYGLAHDAELRILEAVRALDREQPVDLIGTFLGAHVVPPDRRDDRAGYLDELIQHTLPAVAEAGLAHFCDVFVEDTAFSLAEAERVFRAGLDLGLRPKVHAEQLGYGGGAALAARLGAVSADHLEHLDAEGIAALATAGTVAVLLPGASMFLGHDTRPPARALIEAGVPVALSTDCNPGTCMTENLQLMLTLGLSRLGLSPTEALEAVTVNAARALALEHSAGILRVGRAADLAVFDVPDHHHLPYHFGHNHTWRVFKAGREVWRASTH